MLVSGLPAQSHIFGLLADGLHWFLQSAAIDGLAIGPDMMVTDLGYAKDFCLVSFTALGTGNLGSALAAVWHPAL